MVSASFKASLALALTAISSAMAQGLQANGQGGVYRYPIDGPVNGETGGSLSSNPTVAFADLTVRGSSWLWAAFAIMLASGIGVLAWALTRPVGQRAFHYIGVMILFTASVAYFTLASNLGAVAIYVEFVRYNGDLFTNQAINPYTRSIWYVRYIDWTITTPLLLLELLLGTGLPLSDIILVIFFDLVMIIGGLIGALVVSQYKWGYFVGACVAEIFITYMLVGPARKSARVMGNDVVKAYTGSAIALSAIWFLYPVCWGLADGGNVISTDSEMIFYGVLDVIAKPGFLIFHLFQLRKIPYETFGLQSGHYSETAAPGSATANHGKKADHHIDNNNGRMTQTGAPATVGGKVNNAQMHPTGRASDVTAV